MRHAESTMNDRDSQVSSDSDFAYIATRAGAHSQGEILLSLEQLLGGLATQRIPRRGNAGKPRAEIGLVDPVLRLQG